MAHIVNVSNGEISWGFSGSIEECTRYYEGVVKDYPELECELVDLD